MTERPAPFGFLVVRKDAGPSSAQCGFRVRRALAEALGGATRARDVAVGHFGTLDPAATGVLPLAVGKATRLLPLIVDRSKTYRFTLVLGAKTATGDAVGAPTAWAPVPDDARERLRAVLPRFRGAIRQTPPMASALHHDGRRLYELQREGVEVDRPSRAIEIAELSLLDDPTEAARLDAASGPVDAAARPLALRVRCSEGTYVRSLCEDLAVAIGTLGHMGSLVRERAGPFAWERARPLEALVADPLGSLFDPREVMALPQVALDAAEGERYGRGMPVPRLGRAEAGAIAFVVDAGARLLGTARVDETHLRPQRVFA